MKFPWRRLTARAEAEQQAAEWTLRVDRGLGPDEQDAFSQWLSSDPLHRRAWNEHRKAWDEMDRLAGIDVSVHAAPDPDLLAPRRRRAVQPAFVAMAAAAAIVLGALVLRPTVREQPAKPVVAETIAAPSPVNPLALIETRLLSDGSSVQLNRGASLTELFTAGERRVRLDRGEAFFSVAKDPSRPFIVEASGISVRAVGTAFNVRREPASVEVLVTEGRVGVARALAVTSVPVSPDRWPLHLGVGEHTVVPIAGESLPRVATLPAAEIEARLCWKPQLLDFTNAPLAEIIEDFNRRNPVHLSVQSEELAGRRLSATFRSDNVEGFLRLLQSDFGVQVERLPGGEIRLRPAP